MVHFTLTEEQQNMRALTVIVAAAQIGLQLGVVSQASAAGLVAAGLLSVVISPALGLVLLRRAQPEVVQSTRPRPGRHNRPAVPRGRERQKKPRQRS